MISTETTNNPSLYRRPRIRLMHGEYKILIDLMEGVALNEDEGEDGLSGEEKKLLAKLKVILANIEKNGIRNHYRGKE